MRRHVSLLVPAPGREDEAHHALTTWLARAQSIAGFGGGGILVDNVRSHGLHALFVFSYDFDFARDGASWREATKSLPSPLRSDTGSREPPDQSWALASGERDRSLTYDMGGGLFARVLHLHLDLDTDVPAARRP